MGARNAAVNFSPAVDFINYKGFCADVQNEDNPAPFRHWIESVPWPLR